MLVSSVGADILMLKQQGTSIHDIDSLPIIPKQFHKESASNHHIWDEQIILKKKNQSII